jgi:glycosyltransferase involved in cell wall biosynthesis
MGLLLAPGGALLPCCGIARPHRSNYPLVEETVRIVYFSKSSEEGPSSRYRIYQFLPYLEKAGIHCSIRPLMGPTYFTLLEVRNAALRTIGKTVYVGARFLRRFWDLVRIGRPDIVVIEGQLFPYWPPWVERVLVLLGKRIVLEFDDAIYLTRFHRRKMPALLKMSAATIVGNATLLEYARRNAAEVTVIPTVVDTERFTPQAGISGNATEGLDGPITIVWIGLAYNFSYLEILAPALRLVQNEMHARFRVISSRPPILAGVEVEFRPWALRNEVRDLQECHIGVMPLPDSEWARGKCGLKLLQYMAVGIPSVASSVGVNREIIKSGENGFLATTPDEWCTHLLSLCRDAGLRRRMGEAARRTVEERYSLHVWGPRLVSQYQAIVNQSRPMNVGDPVVRTLIGHF